MCKRFLATSFKLVMALSLGIGIYFITTPTQFAAAQRYDVRDTMTVTGGLNNNGAQSYVRFHIGQNRRAFARIWYEHSTRISHYYAYTTPSYTCTEPGGCTFGDYCLGFPDMENYYPDHVDLIADDDNDPTGYEYMVEARVYP